MKKLIVNADDFGLTPGVCDGILKGFHEGIVTSTTILVNSPHIESYLDRLKNEKLINEKKLDLGVHLNVTWGKPISDPSHVKTLLGENGSFIRRTSFDDVNLDEIRTEWKAQVKKARALKLPITHLDTHHHTHLHPALLDILLEIVEEEQCAVRSQAPWVRDFFRANGIATSDFFIGDFYGEGKTSRAHLEELLVRLQDGFTELCSHPGVVDETLRKISSYNEPRAQELETFTAPELKAWLKQNDIELANFASLPKPSGAPDKSCEIKSLGQ